MDLPTVEQHVEMLRQMALAVYLELKSGYDEIVYKEALMVELREAHIAYERERYVPILYKGKYVIGTGKADIVTIPGMGVSIPIECKKTGLKEDDRQQLRTYMDGMGSACGHGVLIRFPQPGNAPGDQPLEFYWARRETDGSVAFYKRSSEGAWVMDEGKKERAPVKRPAAKKQAVAQ